MGSGPKPVDTLTVDDLIRAPVWRYVNDDSAGEAAVSAVTERPVSDCSNAVIGVQVTLANGATRWALIGNVDSRDPRAAEHFLTLSVEHGGVWFHLARYHDVDYAERGPEALADFLALDVDQVFPVSFDLSPLAVGDPATLRGEVHKEPRERLSREILIARAVP